MKAKDIVKSPHQFIEQHWGSIENCPQSESIILLAADIKRCTSAIKTKKNEKQLCAKSFKSAADDKSAISTLKSQMQSISEELNELVSKQKTDQRLLLQYFENTGSTDDTSLNDDLPLPHQFNKWSSPVNEEPGSYVITEIYDNSADQWDDYVNNHANACLYHQYQWRHIIKSSFKHENYYFAAFDTDKNIVGILPSTRLNSRLFGDFAVSLPYFNYGGVLANTPNIANRLLEHAANFFKDLGVKHLEIRTNQKNLCSWPATTDKVSMIRALPENIEQLSSELGSKIRAQIKRAQRENVDVLIGGIELLDQFYNVFAINMRDLGTPVYGKSFFSNILQQSPLAAKIIVIQVNNRPVATAFLLSHGDMLEIPWASTLKEANPMSINMLLYWEVLSFAIRTSHSFFDFGRSTKNANTYRFKKQWGAKPVQHYWYYWLNENEELPKLKPDNPKFALLIKIWKLMPVFLTKLIGPSIVKNLP